jgi:hypothetical protein
MFKALFEMSLVVTCQLQDRDGRKREEFRLRSPDELATGFQRDAGISEETDREVRSEP